MNQEHEKKVVEEGQRKFELRIEVKFTKNDHLSTLRKVIAIETHFQQQ